MYEFIAQVVLDNLSNEFISQVYKKTPNLFLVKTCFLCGAKILPQLKL